MKKKILCTLLAAAMVFSLAACGASDTGNENASKETEEAVSQKNEGVESAGDYDKITMRVGNIYNESTTHGQALDLFQQEIEEKSGGAITVDMYHGGSLGSEQDHIQAQKEGSVELIFSGTAGIGLYVPATAVFECF